MSQKALWRNLSASIFVCEAVAFLRSSAAAHLRGKRIIPLLAGEWDFRKAPKAARNLHHVLYQRKTNPQHWVLSLSVTARLIKTQMYSIFGWDMCPHSESHLSKLLQGDPCFHFAASLFLPPLVRAAPLWPLHQNKAGRYSPAARDEDVSGRRQMAGAGGTDAS